jgi:putative ABC transport system permease protein
VLVETLWQDVRYGARMLGRSPGFTAVALLTLAIGIGANSAIFSFVNAILLRPLPYPESDRLVFLSEWSKQVPDMSFSLANFEDLRDQNRVFESLFAFRGQDYVLTGEGEAERLSGRQVTSGFFATLRLHPVIGRAFTRDEDRPGAERVALLGEGLWLRRFGGDPGVLGRRLVLDGEPYTVVGVLPDTLHSTFRRTEIWTSLGRLADRLGGPERRGNHPGIYVLARLAPGADVDRARTDVKALAERLATQYPATNARQSMMLEPALETLVGPLRPALLILLGAVALVLLIACANVANLLLARAASRQKEIAVRTAVGAARGRVVRQLLTESVLLALAGGALGLAVAAGGMSALRAILPDRAPRVGEVALDGAVLAFTFVVALGTGILFGLLPALQTARVDSARTLKEGGRGGTAGRGRQRLRALLVVSEVSLALVLLVGAGLLVKSFLHVLRADPGFAPESALTLTVSLPPASYDAPAKRVAFLDRVLDGLAGVPGVQSYGSTAPLLGGWQTSFTVEGRPEALPGQAPSTDITRVSPGLVRAMGMRLVRGRDFDDRDREGQPLVCLVDETMAATYWPNEDPLGRRLRLGSGHHDDKPWLTVVGVVAHVKNYGVDHDSRVETFVPYRQDPLGFATLVVRTSGDPAALASAVRDVVRSVDPDVPVFSVRPLADVVANEYVAKRVAAQLLGAFAVLALLLAAVGIYGVMSWAVTQRTQEIGVRVALGAERADILRMVLARGMRLAGVGLGVGLGLAFVLARGLEGALGTLLFGVSPTDPPTFSAVPVLLAAVALLACLLPARRALRIDPVRALHYE